MPPEDVSATPQANRRRWYQFRLRTLIVCMVLVSIVLGLFAIRLERARQQAAAVAAIRKFGGNVTYDYSFPDDNPRFSILQLRARSPMPKWLLDWLGEDLFHDVVGVTARLREGMTEDENQEVFQAIEKLKENEVSWVTVIEKAPRSSTQSPPDSPLSPSP